MLQEPLTVKAGDVLKFTAWYDNSTGNPANPDPSATVRWGLQTYNEMHLGYLDYIVPGEAPGKGSSMLRRTIRQRAVEQIEATFDRLDRDKDGYVSEAEAGLLWARIKSADANRDGRLSLQEARTLAATPGGPVSRA